MRRRKGVRCCRTSIGRPCMYSYTGVRPVRDERTTMDERCGLLQTSSAGMYEYVHRREAVFADAPHRHAMMRRGMWCCRFFRVDCRRTSNADRLCETSARHSTRRSFSNSASIAKRPGLPGRMEGGGASAAQGLAGLAWSRRVSQICRVSTLAGSRASF